MKSQSNLTKLEFGGSQLVFDLEEGAALKSLELGNYGNPVKLIGFAGIEHQHPWLFPFPNRLKDGKYSFEGREYSFPHNDYGRPNALHGFVRERTFSIAKQGGDDNENWIELSYESDGDFDPYPFPFTLSIRYSLSAEDLGIEITIVNTGETAMPAGLGWHPYFDLPQGIENAALKLAPCQEIEVGDMMIPTGKKSPSTCFDDYRNLEGVELDTCFELNDIGLSYKTHLKAGDLYEIEIWQDENHCFVQVYTPEDGKSIAIEPMTCGIDAFNSGEGLKILQPGETWMVSCGVRLI